MILSNISKSTADINLKVKVLNFDFQLSEMCKEMIEATKT